MVVINPFVLWTFPLVMGASHISPLTRVFGGFLEIHLKNKNDKIRKSNWTGNPYENKI